MTDAPTLPIDVDIETASGRTMSFPVGSTHPPLRVSLTDAGDSPVDLSNAARVRLRLRDDSESGYTEQAMRVLDAVDGRAEYQWRERDTDTPGTFDARIVVDYADGTSLAVPSRRPLRIHITDD